MEAAAKAATQTGGVTLETMWEIAYMTTCLVVGLTAFAAGFEGFLMRNLGLLDRILMMTAGLLLFIPEGFTDVVGLAIIAAITVMQKRRLKTQIP
ncbi:hypothetical protein AGMMS49957_04280 [Synergistales bacterium]|nr:hypothetical protein AGMMS49957_04280 [Synergistales bacterium]